MADVLAMAEKFFDETIPRMDDKIDCNAAEIVFMTLIFLSFLACRPAADDDVDLLPIPAMGNLKIEEVYYAGSPPTEGIDRYYSDQFIQLRNISEHPIELGGVGIGDIYGLAGETNSGNSPSELAEDVDNVYFGNLWRIPGSAEDVLLAPGDCIRIAQDAADHQPYSTLNHLDAHYETYVESGEDHDDPVVENLESVFYTAGYDWLVTVFGPSIVVVAPSAFDAMEIVDQGWTDVLKVPAEDVIDTMEALMDEDSGDFKRLPSHLDAGFTYTSGTYSGESVRRISADGELQDTDDSGVDYAVGEPVADCIWDGSPGS